MILNVVDRSYVSRMKYDLKDKYPNLTKGNLDGRKANLYFKDVLRQLEIHIDLYSQTGDAFYKFLPYNDHDTFYDLAQLSKATYPGKVSADDEDAKEMNKMLDEYRKDTPLASEKPPTEI